MSNEKLTYDETNRGRPHTRERGKRVRAVSEVAVSPRWPLDQRASRMSRTPSSAASGFEKPQEAIDEKERRDKRDSDAFIAKVNAEAKAATGSDKSKKVA
jgi:hypothetical protein